MLYFRRLNRKCGIRRALVHFSLFISVNTQLSQYFFCIKMYGYAYGGWGGGGGGSGGGLFASHLVRGQLLKEIICAFLRRASLPKKQSGSHKSCPPLRKLQNKSCCIYTP